MESLPGKAGIEAKLVDELVDIFSFLSKEVKKDDLLKSLRSRARRVPTDIFTEGLSYFTITCVSKGRFLDDFDQAFKEITNGNKLKDVLSKQNSEKEEYGYGSYLLILAYLLKKLEIVKKDLDLGGFLKEATTKPYLTERALFLADWIKRFAEAYLPEP